MDMTNMLPLLREDGVMFVDDVENPGYHLKELVPKFARDNKLTCKMHRVHNVLAELRRTRITNR
jgi:predicted O-methyltransferase YrrM